METHLNLHNRFDIEVIDALSGEVKQKAYAENIMLDTFFTRFLAGQSGVYMNDSISYGRGTGTLNPTRTALFSLINSLASTLDSSGYTDDYIYSRVFITLLPEVSIGETITEVGLRSSSYLVTHALLKDMNGNPVSILKTSTDQIKIYSTLYVQIPSAGFMSGQLGKRLKDSLYNSFIYSINGFLQGFYSVISNYLYFLNGRNRNSASTITSFTRTLTVATKTSTVYARLLTTGLNNLLIGAIENIFYYDLMLANETVLTDKVLGTGNGSTKDFTTVFPFVKSIQSIKLAGVATTDYTADLNKNVSNDMTSWLREIETTDSSYRFGVTTSSLGHIVTSPVGYYIFKNEFNASNPLISCILGANLKLFSSDDGVTWALAATAGSSYSNNVSIPSAHQSKRFYKIEETLGAYQSYCIKSFLSSANTVQPNIHFNTAPPAGTEIKIDYTVPGIAKDDQHVVDVTFTYVFNEGSA